MSEEWEVLEAKEVTKSLRKIPQRIREKYKLWIEIVRFGGPQNLKNYPGFKDEKLKGNLSEYRASRLNLQYRVIYAEERQLKEIYVLKITPHKYEEV